MRVRFAVSLLAFLALCSSPVFGQLAQGELRGSITDESGGVLPGVNITAIHVETGTSRTTTTGVNGTYLMPAMPLGTYKMTAELSGFGTTIREGFRLGVGEAVTINFTMKVASLQESVTVSGAAPIIDTKKSELTGHVTPEQVQSLPLNGRNWLDLVSMVPGARGNPGDIRAGASNNDAARYQMDGLSVTGQGTGGETQSYSQEIIAEVEVLTNRYDAEYGRVTGAVVNAVTKSGTNQYRGSAYYYLRDDAMNAKDFITGAVTPLHQPQSGFTFGGPVVHDRAFFFGSYEYQRSAITNRPSTGIALFDVNVPAPQTRHLVSGRLDSQLSSNNRLFFRTNPFKELRLNETIGTKTTATAGDNLHSYNQDGVVGWTWVVSDRLVSEVRTGVFYFNKRLEELAQTPRYSFPSANLGPANNNPQWWREQIYQASESLSYFLPGWHGDHKIKAGFQYQLSYYQGELPSKSYGVFNFARDPVNFLDPSTYPPPTQYTTSLGDFGYNVNNPAYGAYAQDDWTVHPRLTLNLGLRYDVEPSVGNPGLEQQQVEPGNRKTEKTNFGPRVGFAYDVRGDAKTIVRGGVGRYFGNILLNIPMNEARSRNRQVQITVLNPSLADPLQGLTFEQLLARPRNLIIMANDYKAPVQNQASIGIAQDLNTRYAIQADVVHQVGHNIQMSRSINFFENANGVPINPTVAGRPFPQFVNITRYESTGRSQYDALQFGFNGRRGPGGFMDVQAGYTLAWTKGSTDANRFGAVNNPFNLDDEYSYTIADQRHRISVNSTAYLPYGINASVIAFIGSPRPINISTNLDPFGNSANNGTNRWLNAAGDVLPKNGARALYWDKKIDLRFTKNIKIAGRSNVQAVVDVFDVFNTANYNPTAYGATFGTAAYLLPAFSSNLFYQPRMAQVGARVTF